MIENSRNVNKEAASLAVIASLLRLIPHPPNFAPIGAVSLLSGSKLPGWQAYAVPIISMLATDPILSYMAGFPAFSSGSLIIYLSFLLTVLMGRSFLKNKPSLTRVSTVSIAAAALFFITTNLAVWWGGNLYPHTSAGLTTCYIAALPFLAWSVLGNLFYSSALFIVTAQLGKQKEALKSF